MGADNTIKLISAERWPKVNQIKDQNTTRSTYAQLPTPDKWMEPTALFISIQDNRQIGAMAL